MLNVKNLHDLLKLNRQYTFSFNIVFLDSSYFEFTLLKKSLEIFHLKNGAIIIDMKYFYFDFNYAKFDSKDNF